MPAMVAIPPCTVLQRARGSEYQRTHPRDGEERVTGHSQNIHKNLSTDSFFCLIDFEVTYRNILKEIIHQYFSYVVSE